MTRSADVLPGCCAVMVFSLVSTAACYPGRLPHCLANRCEINQLEAILLAAYNAACWQGHQRGAKMAKIDTPRIAVLGAGPIGLEAALYARSLNLTVTIYERGRVGEHLQHWGHIRLFSPFGMNATPLGRAAIHADSPKHNFPNDTDCTTAREHLTAYLEPLVKTGLLIGCMRTDTLVGYIARRGF